MVANLVAKGLQLIQCALCSLDASDSLA